MSIENPDADRFEQLRPVDYGEYDEDENLDLENLPLDADLLDVADQHRPVLLNDDQED